LEYLSDSSEWIRLTTPETTSPVEFIIGAENEAAELRDISVVMASYHMGDNLQGLIGVVGPTRMQYAKLASHLSYFANRLGLLLSGDVDKDG
jgi:heat-inducible transcriptional repressor